MNSMRPFVSTGGGTAAATALAPVETRHAVPQEHVPAARVSEPARSTTGYGLPCAKCRKYYPASLSACPVCKSAERVTPVELAPSHAVPASASPSPAVDQETERILREFKAQMYGTHTQIATTAPNPCAHAKGQGRHEEASVCKTCYARLQERVDVLEASLLIDPKEAAQVVYHAVWADTSDPNKTYHNAAQALLNEVRRRAGIKAPINRAQSLPH